LHPPCDGRADVGLFFALYAEIDGVSLASAWLEDREVVAVFEDRADPKPSYIMWLEWRDGQISFIHAYRYVRYATAAAEVSQRWRPSPLSDIERPESFIPWPPAHLSRQAAFAPRQSSSLSREPPAGRAAYSTEHAFAQKVQPNTGLRHAHVGRTV
jgi:hypothetical protein